MSSNDISKKLIERFGVITIPGEIFGAKYPSLRISFGNLDENMAVKACDRLKNGLIKII
jgi:aspartate/methionine/tyrosine aminotransferase